MDVRQAGRRGAAPAAWRSPTALLATFVLLVGLVAAAVLTVRDAGCDDPGTLVARGNGVLELQGGCIAAGDLVVPGAPLSTLPAANPGGDRP